MCYSILNASINVVGKIKGFTSHELRNEFPYRIYITKGQRRLLEQQLEECRWLYNQTLAARKNAWEDQQRSAVVIMLATH